MPRPPHPVPSILDQVSNNYNIITPHLYSDFYPYPQRSWVTRLCEWPMILDNYYCLSLGQFLLSNLGASATSDPSELVEVASAENDVVIPSLSDIVTTYSIIPPPLTSLTSLTTTSTLESVFNEPVMSVAVAGDAGETSSDINVESVLQS